MLVLDRAPRLLTGRIGIALPVLVALCGAALLAPVLSPHDPNDLASLSLLDSELPPIGLAGADPRFPLGTDAQGRDLLSAILHGLRLSLLIAAGAVAGSVVLGTGLGLLAAAARPAGFAIMRVGDVVLSLPTMMTALLISALARASLPGGNEVWFVPAVLVASIAVNEWVQYARVVQVAARVELAKDYVGSARLLGLSPARIMLRHVLPNIVTPVIVIATVGLPIAIIAEATLSFLGLGMPPTRPSLGTLIRGGSEHMYAGTWWVIAFPAATLAVLTLSANAVAERLRRSVEPTQTPR